MMARVIYSVKNVRVSVVCDGNFFWGGIRT